MSIAFLFWLLMLLWLIFGFFGTNGNTTVGNVTVPNWGGHVFLWVILALLGWGIFGFPIHN